MVSYDILEQTPAALGKTSNNRQAPRVAKRIELVLQTPGDEQNYQTTDISYLGVFVECPTPLPLGKLVRFKVRLSQDKEHMQMLGVVAHRINSADAMETGRPPGMGIQVFPLGPEVRSNWRHFVRQEYDKDPQAAEDIKKQELPRLKVHFPNTEKMVEFTSQHLASGDVFVRSADLYQQGTRLWLEVVHPKTSELQGVEAIVMEFVEAPRQSRGMRLMIQEAEAASHRLTEFAQAPTE